MTTIVHARASRQITTTERNYPLLHVLIWELRRVLASRLFWFQALGFFCFQLFLTWALHASEGFDTVSNNVQINASIAGTSARGLLHTLPLVLVVLVLLLPFVTADGVTRDFSRRTHELLMTTALPTWAYVWGRYLAGLLISLGLALLLLASILGMGGLLHLTVAAYPLPQIGAVLLLWVGMVLPATILVSSFGFALSTLLPRLSTLVKVVILVAWIVGALVIPAGWATRPLLLAGTSIGTRPVGSLRLGCFLRMPFTSAPRSRARRSFSSSFSPWAQHAAGANRGLCLQAHPRCAHLRCLCEVERAMKRKRELRWN
jgi:ABC-type transport system involved in multi-copper enzyme maturation permease subunit